MAYKPMDAKEYQKLLKIVKWTLEKGGIDYNLRGDAGHFVCSIIITHGKNTKKGEIPAFCVRKTEKIFKGRGLKWPPKKK